MYEKYNFVSILTLKHFTYYQYDMLPISCSSLLTSIGDIYLSSLYSIVLYQVMSKSWFLVFDKVAFFTNPNYTNFTDNNFKGMLIKGYTSKGVCVLPFYFNMKDSLN